MLKYAKETTQFVEEDCTFEDFKDDRKTIAACVFNVSQIGELVKDLDKRIIDKYAKIKWIAIRNIRHRIVHDYEGLQLELIWEVIKDDLPVLIDNLKYVVKQEKKP